MSETSQLMPAQPTPVRLDADRLLGFRQAAKVAPAGEAAEAVRGSGSVGTLMNKVGTTECGA
jgi:hypothetical protein